MGATGEKWRPQRGLGGIVRWECRCQDPPVLLGTYDAAGRIHIKTGDRYYHVHGQVRTVCPRCGTEHILNLGDLLPDAR